MTKTDPLPHLAPDTTPAPTDDLPILLTEGEPIGESVFAHSTLEDPQHPSAHRDPTDIVPPSTPGGPSFAASSQRVGSDSPQRPGASPSLAAGLPGELADPGGVPPSAKAGEPPQPSTATQQVHVHKARLQDARNIFDLVNSLSGDGTLLRRSYAEICENIRDFTVAELPPTPEQVTEDPTADPEFLGCGALHLYGPHLAEVRSIVLHPHARGKGAGAALLTALLAESEDHGVATTCLFTRLPAFFERFGFRVAERNAMPDKIYKDCQACPRLYACDEVAMVKGPLPNMAVLGPIQVKQPKLVQVQLSPTGTSR